jgi:nucleoside phosphorylase
MKNISNKKFFVCATKTEAQNIIDTYNLRKLQNKNFSIFSSFENTLIISGIGKINCALAVSHLANNFNIQEKDEIINFGICGSSKYKIGTKLDIGMIIDIDDGKKYILNSSKETLHCSSKPILNEASYSAVDMESTGFYIASKKCFKNIQIQKIVSDNFDNFDPSTLKEIL